MSIWTVLMLLILGLAPAIAQSIADDPKDKDNSPVKAGYAIITPSLVGGLATDSPKGLVVFETFGEHRGQETTQAGVLPSSLSTDFLLFVSTSGRLSRNLGVAIANLEPVEAIVTLTLRKPDGTDLFPGKQIHIGSLQQVASFVTQIFSDQNVPRDFTGTLAISSTQPVAVVGLRFRGMNFSTLPATPTGPIVSPPDDILAADNVKIGGAFAVVLPQFATGGGWASELVLINSGVLTLNVRVDLFDQAGKPLQATLNGVTDSVFKNIAIPPGGVVVLSPRDMNGDSDF